MLGEYTIAADAMDDYFRPNLHTLVGMSALRGSSNGLRITARRVTDG